MADFRVDDTVAFNDKHVEAGNAAVGLWTRCGAWSMQQLTDGFVPKEIARTIGTQTQIKKLVETKLWAVCVGGYQFNNWNEFQRTKSQVEKDKAAARERMAKIRSGERSGEHKPNFARTSPEVTPNVRDSLPFPTQVPNGTSKESGSRKRGTRLFEDWMPEESTKQWARDEFPNVNLRLAHEKFVNHFLAEPGAKGLKLDWDRTWRNWIIKEAQFARPPSGRNASGMTPRETEIYNAERLKENPDPQVLSKLNQSQPDLFQPNLRAINGGAS